LFAAIAMDTGWMHHSNTDPRALRSLAVLVERGAAPAEIYRQLFERNSPSRYRLMGTLFNRIERELEGRLSHATVRWNDIGAAGAHPMDTEDFVQLLMGIDGVETALLFIEQEGGGTKVSFRSRGRLDCAATAGLFGGGGHQLAAGASVADAPEIIRGKILRVVRERLGAAVERPPIAAT
jgi:phosphoesterase RecJ-like protein